METYAIALMILLIVGVVGLFSFVLIKYYVDSTSTALTTGVAVLGIFVALFCVMLVPVDVYTVSSSLNSDGSQTNAALVSSSGTGIKTLYYIFYSVLLFLAFVLMPFAYFYYEEEYEESSVRGRACAASKYTFAFLLVFGLLLALGVVLRTEKGSNNDWKSILSNDFDAGDAILTFAIGALATIGLFFWIPYAGYGLAAFPISLMRSDESAARADSEEGLIQDEEDPTVLLRKNTEELNYLKAQNPGRADEWTAEDRKKLRQLEREQRRLSQKQKQTTTRRSTVQNKTTAKIMSCWTCLTPIRFVLGIVFVLVSLLVMVSLLMSTIDKFLHSDCGAGCGYTLSNAQIQNPIDQFLNILSQAFPLDFVFFAFLTVFIFFAAINGLVSIGVRLCVWKLYNVRAGKTPPNAMLLGAWLLMFVVLVLNMQILNLSPQYASFGKQFYYPAINGTEIINGTFAGNITYSTDKQVCSMEQIHLEGHCVLTQIGTFVNTLNLQLPFFGTILFYANLVFLAVFVVSCLVATLCKPSNYKKMDDDAFLDAD